MYAIVEIMGHRVRAGMISDAVIGGATMLRIEHPSEADHTGEEPLTEYYAPQAIFAIRPCSQDLAAKTAATCWPILGGAERLALAAPFEDLVDEDEDPEDSDEFFGPTPF